MNITIEMYVAEIQAAAQARYDALKYTIPVPTYSATTGKKYYKVIELNYGQKSVHCFVDVATGDIYKPASWNAPAKGIRGNLQDAKKPLLCGDFYRYK